MKGRQRTATDLIAQAATNGYKRGAHKEQDEIRDREKHVEKTRINQDGTLRRYIAWYLSEMQKDTCLRPGVEAPDLVHVKDFIRFYISTSNPRLAKRPTVDSINTTAEWFFAGFTRAIGTKTDAEERSEVYNWVRRVLTMKGLVVNKRLLKHNFTNRDLNRRWVKNNRDPNNIVFNSAGREHKKFIYNNAAFLLVMAIADGALFGYKTLDDLQIQEIPAKENELPLRRMGHAEKYWVFLRDINPRYPSSIRQEDGNWKACPNLNVMYMFSRTRPGHDLLDVPEELGPRKSSLGSADTLGGSTRKRKLIDNKHILAWAPPCPSSTQPSRASPSSQAIASDKIKRAISSGRWRE
ncbi:hypothetical protein GJ744_003901 [Endocarpon pusillum]|uniref:Uncharacterized protein n=1 Tax=Endocarpon pusillum TaxID=364733 RepID=A0A8H7A6F2_9EURO|nr:hypothetical protein GJ744_003901 [Endocarpon pusillum]